MSVSGEEQQAGWKHGREHMSWLYAPGTEEKEKEMRKEQGK
jgi:hypothetical protein